MFRAYRRLAEVYGQQRAGVRDLRHPQPICVLDSLIVTAKMNDIDPQAWLADVLARIAAHPAHRLDELPPWNWKTLGEAIAVNVAA